MDGNSLANASVIIYKIYRFREAERRAGEKFTRFTRFRSLASRRKKKNPQDLRDLARLRAGECIC